ncbi:hypothetical protein [Halosimplex sp. TS25]|uniref:hypothetical protein n=1 Tax=Halosimplex rarum TaxID=3396619 RepID=UPI0039EC7969
MNIAQLARSGSGLSYAAARRAYDAYLGTWYTITSRYPLGTNVYDREWDALLVLDACRVDALRAVAPEYDFLDADRIERTVSVGSHSFEWLAKTFTGDRRREVADTAYLTANTHAQMLFVDGDTPPYEREIPGRPAWDPVDAADFGRLDMVWRDGHDDDLGNVPPRRVTDRLVDVARSEDHGRVIAHFMQPHAPYLAGAIAEDRDPTPLERSPLDAFARGDADRETVWELYLDNLRLVLDEVALALENLDAETVAITADHGEAIGEWGDVDHREAFLHPVVKTVPWIETRATDEGTYEPETAGAPVDDEGDVDVEKRLRDLGYV